jgi:hypothetical protein
VTNHPNRRRKPGIGAANPTPAQVRAAREACGMTIALAASVVYASPRTWEDWEATPTAARPALRRMHPAIWELFCIKTGYKPEEQRDE